MLIVQNQALTKGRKKNKRFTVRKARGNSVQGKLQCALNHTNWPFLVLFFCLSVYNRNRVESEFSTSCQADKSSSQRKVPLWSCSCNLEPLLSGCVMLIYTSTISVFSFLVCLPLLVIHRYVMLSRAYVNSVADSTLEMKPVEKQVHKAFRGRDGLLQHLLF